METQSNQNPIFRPAPLRAFFWDLTKILGLSLLIIIPFRLFIAEPFVVSGSSMLPNFHNKDYLIVDRISYRTNPPKRGDVVVIKFPKDNRQYFIKRIIGLPGESLELKAGRVMITSPERPGSWELKESYLPPGAQTFGGPGLTVLGNSEYFVLGDNRTASSDSRVWGVLPESDIVGRAFFRVFPFWDFGLIKSAKY